MPAFNDRSREEFPRNSPQQEHFERRSEERLLGPTGTHHQGYEDRGSPITNDFHRAQQYRPPLLPLPHSQAGFNDRAAPQMMRPVGETMMPVMPREQKIKTITAEKIFDQPGRNERPSHVR